VYSIISLKQHFEYKYIRILVISIEIVYWSVLLESPQRIAKLTLMVSTLENCYSSKLLETGRIWI